MTNIRTQTAPILAGAPKASFQADAFDALLWNQGYRVELEEARQCPCQSLESGTPLVTCQNCRACGWLFLNPITTKAVISNINKKTKYGVEWSEESIGTILVSLMNVDRLADMDRITFLDVVSKWSERRRVRTVNGQQFVFLTYKPQEILDVFYLQNAQLPLIKLIVDEDYSLHPTNPYILNLNIAPIAGWNSTVTVTYMCNPQYHVIDLPHELRAGTIINQMGQIEKVDLPVNAVLKKSHLCLSLNDYDGGIQTLDNSYR
jgi:hypothetical protein